MFQRRINNVLKAATIKRKDILPIGSIFFLLKVAPMRIESNFKMYQIEKLPKLIYANMPLC